MHAYDAEHSDREIYKFRQYQVRAALINGHQSYPLYSIA